MLAAGGEDAAELPSAVLSSVEPHGSASMIGMPRHRLSPPSAALGVAASEASSVIAKFKACAALHVEHADVEHVLAAILALDSPRSVRELAFA